MDNKLACDRDVSDCSVHKTKSTWRKVANELATWDWTFSIVNCIGYQMISADKLYDHAIKYLALWLCLLVITTASL